MVQSTEIHQKMRAAKAGGVRSLIKTNPIHDVVQDN